LAVIIFLFFPPQGAAWLAEAEFMPAAGGLFRLEIFLKTIFVTWLVQVSRELDRLLIIDTRRRNV
jgi:hypothetical protein